MNVEFLGGARTVTGSATLLEKDPCKWLVDCGMFQGGEEIEKRNWKIQPYQAKDLSFILLTHAHIDHSGLIPKLVREGFRGKVKRGKRKGEAVDHPRWWRQLEEVQQKLEELEKEIE